MLPMATLPPDCRRSRDGGGIFGTYENSTFNLSRFDPSALVSVAVSRVAIFWWRCWPRNPRKANMHNAARSFRHRCSFPLNLLHSALRRFVTSFRVLGFCDEVERRLKARHRQEHWPRAQTQLSTQASADFGRCADIARGTYAAAGRPGNFQESGTRRRGPQTNPNLENAVSKRQKTD